jgi:hypothetical protein
VMYDHKAYQATYRASHKAESLAYRQAHREAKRAYDRAYDPNNERLAAYLEAKQKPTHGNRLAPNTTSLCCAGICGMVCVARLGDPGAKEPDNA